MPLEAKDRVIDLRNPAERMRQLQTEMAEALDLARSGIRVALATARRSCAEALDFPTLPPGEREEYRQLTEAISASMERLKALEGRS